MQEHSNKKKIFFLLPNLKGGGAERVFLTLAEQITKAAPNWKVVLVVFSSEGEYYPLVPKGIELHDLHCPRARHAFWKLHKLCRAERPDVVLSTMQATTVFFLVRLFLWQKPVFLSRLENLYSFDVQNLSRIARRMFRLALEYCDYVIVPAMGMVEDLLKNTSLSKERIVQIYNPVDIIKVERLAAEPSNLSLQHPAIVMCGRLTKQKGYPYALKVFVQVREKHPDTHLYILGDGEERESLQELIKQEHLNNSVHICGFVENPYLYFAKADVFLLTSLWEGFGLVLVETMACGLPVASFDSPTGPREVLDGGKFGKLVPLKDTEGLAEAVSELLTEGSQNADLTAASKQRAHDFAVDKIGKEYIDLFNTL